jgi:hypothetical protein
VERYNAGRKSQCGKLNAGSNVGDAPGPIQIVALDSATMNVFSSILSVLTDIRNRQADEDGGICVKQILTEVHVLVDDAVVVTNSLEDPLFVEVITPPEAAS